jgi:hypothetical protein
MRFSWGGGAVADFCRLDDRCRAAIVLEGYLQNVPELVQQGLFKPLLSIYRGIRASPRFNFKRK